MTSRFAGVPGTQVGLRIDVDTLRGTRRGVPCMLEILERRGVRASFFFSVGPDNMGRNLWRLMNPKFLVKMMRSNAASLYGWDIVLCGAFFQGPEIGVRCAAVIRAAADAGHEIGLHAWDHYGWQRHAGKWSVAEQRGELQRGFERLTDIVGAPVDCCAVAGWRSNELTMEAERELGFRYCSDCRGSSVFKPILGDGAFGAPQIPITLPTYDEVIGRETDLRGYNDYILARMRNDRLKAYTVHAEVEGIALASEFEELLVRGAADGLRFTPLGELLPVDASLLPADTVTTARLAGREGWVGWQTSALAHRG